MVSKRLLMLVFTACGVSACAHTHGGDQLSVELRSLSEIPVDPQIRKSSDAIYYYLLGELAYQDEDFKGALSNFAKAGALAEVPAASLHSKLAELYVRNGDIEKARAEAEKALKEDPNSEPNLFLYGGVLETLGRTGEAENVYKRLLSRDKRALEAYLLLAGLYAKQARYDEAVTVLEKLAANPSYQVLAWYQLGHIYEQKQEFLTAAGYYLKVYEKSGRGSSIVADVLRVYLQDGAIDKARAFCRQVLKRDPDNAVARRVQDSLVADQRGFTAAVAQLQELKNRAKDPNESRFKIALMEIERQNFDLALRELNLILAAEPSNSEARFYLASVYAATGRSGEAIAELKRIQQGDPMYVRARTFAAFVLMQEGDLEGAEAVAREAWNADRGNRRVFYYLISILRDERKFDDAEELLAQAAREDLQDAELWFQYGVVLHDLKREGEAVAKMEQVIQMDPGYSDALNYIAYSLAESGKDLGRALDLVEKALESKPEDAYYIDTLGWVYFQMGDYESAEKELSRAARFSRRDAVILEHYGDVLDKLGKFKEAAAIYRSIIQLAAGPSQGKLKDEEEEDSVARAQEKLRELEDKHPDAKVEPSDAAEEIDRVPDVSSQ